MANDCAKHAGKSNETRRLYLDEIMWGLPENQSGAGRHKCTYCSYEQGYKDGLHHAANALRKMLLRESEISLE